MNKHLKLGAVTAVTTTAPALCATRRQPPPQRHFGSKLQAY
ncbi:hypothetical protein ACWCV9_29845 [Streptomyces sp. NPDC001606]